MRKRSPFADTWVIVPAYNEATYIQSVLKRIQKYTQNIIVVDDGSRDKTFLFSQLFAPHVLRHGINLGKGAALKTGCEYAFYHCKAKAVIFIDADAQHDPDELVLFFKELSSGIGIIFGSRSIGQNMPFLRIFGNKLASYFTQILFGAYIPDIPSGFKAFTRETYEKIKWNSTGYTVEMEIAARVAKNRIPFSSVCITTIYHDMNKGMTILDLIHIFILLINWKFSL